MRSLFVKSILFWCILEGVAKSDENIYGPGGVNLGPNGDLNSYLENFDRKQRRPDTSLNEHEKKEREIRWRIQEQQTIQSEEEEARLWEEEQRHRNIHRQEEEQQHWNIYNKETQRAAHQAADQALREERERARFKVDQYGNPIFILPPPQ
jgi:hypothetical protein